MYFTGKSLWEIVTGAETVNNEASESQKKKQKTIATNLKFMFILLKLQINGRSRPDVFCKKRFLKKLSKFTAKHLYQSLFIGVFL